MAVHDWGAWLQLSTCWARRRRRRWAIRLGSPRSGGCSGCRRCCWRASATAWPRSMPARPTARRSGHVRTSSSCVEQRQAAQSLQARMSQVASSGLRLTGMQPLRPARGRGCGRRSTGGRAAQSIWEQDRPSAGRETALALAYLLEEALLLEGPLVLLEDPLAELLGEEVGCVVGAAEQQACSEPAAGGPLGAQAAAHSGAVTVSGHSSSGTHFVSFGHQSTVQTQAGSRISTPSWVCAASVPLCYLAAGGAQLKRPQ